MFSKLAKVFHTSKESAQTSDPDGNSKKMDEEIIPSRLPSNAQENLNFRDSYQMGLGINPSSKDSKNSKKSKFDQESTYQYEGDPDEIRNPEDDPQRLLNIARLKNQQLTDLDVKSLKIVVSIGIDEKKQESMHEFSYKDIPISFPFAPYPQQVQYMNKVVDALEAGEHALLQSPTGTGKTASLLNSTLGWLRAKRASKDQDFASTTIIYTSRTHSQLKQAVSELKDSCYRPRSVVFGSRDHYCVNSELDQYSGQSKKLACLALCRSGSCQYYTNEMRQKTMPPTLSYKMNALKQIMDIEDLKDMCLDQTVDLFCPFYASKIMMKQGVDIIFIPYTYITDTSLRGMFAPILKESILIFDEAHNIQQAAEEGGSFGMTSFQVTDAITELKGLYKIIGNTKNDFNKKNKPRQNPKNEDWAKRMNRAMNQKQQEDGRDSSEKPQQTFESQIASIDYTVDRLYWLAEKFDNIVKSDQFQCQIEENEGFKDTRNGKFILEFMLQNFSSDPEVLKKKIIRFSESKRLEQEQQKNQQQPQNNDGLDSNQEDQNQNLSNKQIKNKNKIKIGFEDSDDSQAQEDDLLDEEGNHNQNIRKNINDFIDQQFIQQKNKGAGGRKSFVQELVTEKGNKKKFKPPKSKLAKDTQTEINENFKQSRLNIRNKKLNLKENKIPITIESLQLFHDNLMICQETIRQQEDNSFINGSTEKLLDFIQHLLKYFNNFLEKSQLYQKNAKNKTGLQEGWDELQSNHYCTQISSAFKGELLGLELTCKCLNPAITFDNIKQFEPRSIILTSGTLTPFAGYEAELDLEFKHQLECAHVIDSKQQIKAAIVERGNESSFYFTYDKRKDPKLFVNLGLMINTLCRQVPNGMLIFFTSYSVLELTIKAWNKHLMGPNSGNLYDQINAKKKICVEQKSKEMMDFHKDLFMANYLNKGAIMLAVLGGKLSEGIDFRDEMARLVIVVGIPYPNIKDQLVKAKIEYLKERRSKSNKKFKLHFETWKMLKTMRSVNQAIGRVIRHKGDHGGVMLCDSRYSSGEYRNQISKWVRSQLFVCREYQGMIKILKSFFIEKGKDWLIQKEQQLEQKIAQQEQNQIINRNKKIANQDSPPPNNQNQEKQETKENQISKLRQDPFLSDSELDQNQSDSTKIQEEQIPQRQLGNNKIQEEATFDNSLDQTNPFDYQNKNDQKIRKQSIAQLKQQEQLNKNQRNMNKFFEFTDSDSPVTSGQQTPNILNNSFQNQSQDQSQLKILATNVKQELSEIKECYGKEQEMEEYTNRKEMLSQMVKSQMPVSMKKTRFSAISPCKSALDQQSKYGLNGGLSKDVRSLADLPLQGNLSQQVVTDKQDSKIEKDDLNDLNALNYTEKENKQFDEKDQQIYRDESQKDGLKRADQVQYPDGTDKENKKIVTNGFMARRIRKRFQPPLSKK